MSNKRLKGRLTWYDEISDKGYIEAPDGSTHPFNGWDIKNLGLRPKSMKNIPVTFELYIDSHFTAATNILINRQPGDLKMTNRIIKLVKTIIRHNTDIKKEIELAKDWELTADELTKEYKELQNISKLYQPTYLDLESCDLLAPEELLNLINDIYLNRYDQIKKVLVGDLADKYIALKKDIDGMSDLFIEITELLEFNPETITVGDLMESFYFDDKSWEPETDIESLINLFEDELIEDIDLSDLINSVPNIESYLHESAESEVSIYTSDLMEFLADSDNSDWIDQAFDAGLEVRDSGDLSKLAGWAWLFKVESAMREDLYQLETLLTDAYKKLEK